jgi:hypothetical protein
MRRSWQKISSRISRVTNPCGESVVKKIQKRSTIIVERLGNYLQQHISRSGMVLFLHPQQYLCIIRG